ncbi:lysine-specific demethylase 7B [Drosophila willistoni]|uniref:lysine-specific demethylase 7B n=1 Tax=Drosophila willistoni TaxID=7260 RepID=UPI000C26DAE0|nr:lysine-specific demethylase 7B [Drosophila willistoni]
MTDFSMNDILRSFRKMRMNKNTGQGGHHYHHNHHNHHQHHHHHHHHNQHTSIYVSNYAAQQTKDLKKVIKIIKKSLLKEKITSQMKILV